MVLLALSLVLAASPYADAKRDYADLNYEACVTKLSDLRAVPPKERASAELLLGLCHFALGHEAQARARLESALRKAPALSAPQNASPKEKDLIEEAREAAANAPAPKTKKTAKKQDKTQDAGGAVVALGVGGAPASDSGATPASGAAPPGVSQAASAPPDVAAAAGAPESAAAAGPTPDGASATSVAPADAPVAASLTPAPAAPPPVQVVQPAPARVPVATWVAGGAAVVAAGVGVGFGLSARGLESQANAEAVQVTADQLRGQAQTDATVANVAFAVAGGAAVTALVTWLVLR